jgi:hypothetical protein
MACTRKYKPLMYVPAATSAHRVGDFVNKKYKNIIKEIKKDDARFVTYTASAFKGMIETMFKDKKIDGIHIYLATYGAKGTESVPEGYDGLLTLIFAATEGAEERKEYYTIFPRSTSFVKMDTNLASAWVKNYQGVKLTKALNPTVPKTNNDTKLIYYTRALIEDLIEEIDCQKATGLRGYFCTMEKEHKYGYRLLIDFVLTKIIGDEVTEFNVEDTDGWSRRKDNRKAVLQKLKKAKKPLDLDTGSPCPPNICHPGLPLDGGL